MRTYFNFPQQKVIVIDGNNSKMFTLDEYNKKINKWRELNKMVKLNEVVKDVEMFTDCEKVKFDEVKNLEMKIKAIAKMKGNDGDFLVIKADIGKDKPIAFSNGSKVVIDKLLRAVIELKVEWVDNVAVFKEALETKIVEKKSTTSGRVYHDLE